jgi:hypothetical protein
LAPAGANTSKPSPSLTISCFPFVPAGDHIAQSHAGFSVFVLWPWERCGPVGLGSAPSRLPVVIGRRIPARVGRFVQGGVMVRR